MSRPAASVAVTHSRNGFRFAEKMEAHIHVVDQEIENAAAAFGCVFQPSAPCRGCTAAAEEGAPHCPETGHRIAQRHILGEEAQHLRAHQDFTGVFRFGNHAVRARAIECDGLFHQYVFAGA